MKNLNSPGRIAAYYRTSSDQQENDQTIEAQRLFVQRYCERHGWQIAAEFADDGVSGLSEITAREQGASLMRAAERREFEAVLVFAVDRVGREAYYVLHGFHHLRRLGIPILSATQAYDPTETSGRLLVALLAGQAETEKVGIYQRTEAGKEKLLAQDALYIGGIIPFGYHLEWERNKRVYRVCDQPIPGFPDWTPRRVIAHLFERFDEGETSYAIAKGLRALGLPTAWVPGDRKYGTPTFGYWNEHRVIQIVRNPFYSGVQRVRRQGEVIERAVPRIVSEALWESCRARRAANKRLSRQPGAEEYLLRGKISCAHCGFAYCGTKHLGGNMPVGRYYRCNYKARAGAGGRCAGTWVDADWLEGQVKERIRWILGHVDEQIAQIATERDGRQQWAAAGGGGEAGAGILPPAGGRIDPVG